MRKIYKIQKSKYKKNEYCLVFDSGVGNGGIGFSVIDGDGESIIRYVRERHAKSVVLLLAAVVSKLKQFRLGLHNVRGVVVREGGESFSAVRGVHAIANALAWSLGVPSATVRMVNGEGIAPAALTALSRNKSFKLLIPLYSREPNITL